MRKLTVGLTGLLALMLIAAALLPWGLPVAGQMVAGPGVQEDGTVLAAENRDLYSRVYFLKNGEIAHLYEEPRFQRQEAREHSIARVAVDGADAYFVRAFQGARDWELMKLEGEQAVSLCSGSFDIEMTVTGLVVKNGVAWITGVGSNGAIFVYEYTEKDGAGLKLIQPVWWLRDTVSAEFDGEKTRATTAYDDHCFMTPDGQKTYDEEAAETPAPQMPTGGMSFLRSKQSVFAAVVVLWLVLALSVVTTYTAVKKARRLATRLTAMGMEVLFLGLLGINFGVFFLVMESAGLLTAVQAVTRVGIASVIVWLTGGLLLRGLAGRMTAPIARLTGQMDRIADGRVDVPEISPKGWDELHFMERSMQEMCMSLAVRDYEVDSMIRSYERFVPEKMTQLLDRANVAEVNLGDSSRIQGNVGLFSVGNRAEVRAVLGDDAFVEFIDHSFGIFQTCLQNNRGSMISNGLRLSAMETLFLHAPEDGVRAGLDFLGRTQREPRTGIPAPRPMLMLHRAPILYGVAGQAERLYPYLSSFELEFLGSFSQRLYEAGARVVATEAYWKQLEGSGFASRYIGFVSDGEKDAYKLYEILDGYPELERKLRMGYDRRFQEAVNLFYHNDFYLARNMFSTLLRACPEDGIARWYLFACEHFFNLEGEFEADYSLFGISEI